MYSNRNTNYLQKLINSGKRVFKNSEIALLWGIDDKNKLHTYLSRYTQRGDLHRLAKGVYSLIQPDKLHPYEIGVALAGELSYVSLESVLFAEGMIHQPVYKVTLVGKKNREFALGDQHFISKYAPMKRLIDRQGITEIDGYAIANQDRALADMRAIKPNYYLDTNL